MMDVRWFAVGLLVVAGCETRTTRLDGGGAGPRRDAAPVIGEGGVDDAGSLPGSDASQDADGGGLASDVGAPLEGLPCPVLPATCGTEVEGRWRVVTECRDVDALNAIIRATGQECQVVRAAETLAISGEWLLERGTYTIDTRAERFIRLEFTDPCVPGTSCGAFESNREVDVTCSQLGPKHCLCDAVGTSPDDPISGTYALSGTTLSIQGAQSATAYQVCRDGDRLVLTSEEVMLGFERVP